MSYEKYGLTATNASSANHDKGIVKAPDGKFYQIDGLKHGQEDKLDKDAGSVFSSSLEADARAASSTYDPTTFNTAGDVENALRNLGEAPKTESKVEPKKYVPSEKIKQAVERVEKFEENDYDIYKTEPSDGDSTAQSYLDNYKLGLREKAAKGELGAVK